MPTRQPVILAVMVAAFWLCGSGRATAQPNPGTVTWATNYPVVTNSVPPNTFGSVTAFGDYTTNAGWTPTGGVFYWSPYAGGVPQQSPLDLLNGKWGKNTNGVMGPQTFTIQ